MIPSLKIKDVSFKDYFEVVWDRKWIVVVIAVIALFYGISTVFLTPEIYRTKAAIAIEGKREGMIAKAWPFFGIGQSRRAFLHSRALAERVDRRLNLREPSEQLLAMVKVTPQRGNSNIVMITVSGDDPVKVTNIANMWAREYIGLIKDKNKAITRESVADLEKQLTEGSKAILQAEMALNDFIKTNRTIADGQRRVKSLNEQISQVEKDIQALSTQYRPDHPKMSFLNSQVEILSKELKEEQDKLPPFQEKIAQYRILQDKIRTERNIYNELSENIQKIHAASSLVKPGIQIVDTAQTPKKPLSKKGRIPQALFIGLFLGAVVCFILEYMDTTLKQAEEVEFYAKMPFLGYLPSVRKFMMDERELNLFSQLKPDSQVAEAFRNVKVALIFASPEEKHMQVLVVTSAVPGEGKSFIASNLAISFARAKENTLLIDGDMKQCSLMGSFEAKDRNGLSDILDDKCGLDEALNTTSIPNLSFLCAGAGTSGATDLLSRQKFETLFEEIRSKFQRIVIDVPSVLEFNDVLFWGDKCDGVISVIGAGTTPLKDITAANKKLAGKADIIGAVLNNIAIEKDFKYYKHYYQSFFEEKFKEKKKTEDK
ncbi:MAG: polysaccharide biosynthesis tyrosine autokinase [Candidatus Omnitrophota bacterium]